MNRDRPLLVALALLSAAITAQQVILMQVLGWMHWHHFAYLIVAVALLGFGASGTALSLARATLLPRWETLLPWLLLATAAAIPLGVRAAQLPALAVDLPLVFFDPLRHAWRLGALCVLLLPPFFLGGLATGLILIARVRTAGRTYAASLAGAGLGGLVGLGFISQLEPPRLPAAVASIAIAAALPLVARVVRRSARPSRNTYRFLLPFAAILTAAGVATAWLWPVPLQPSQFKPLRRTLDLPGAHIVASRPGVHGWIQIVEAPALRPAPAVSLDFAGEIPPQRAVFVNGLGYGSLLDAGAVQAPRWLDFTTDAAAFISPAPRQVLLLENGPGGWAALAAAHGAAQITVVEPNRPLVALLTDPPPPLAPEWRLPTVDLAITSGRTFLRRGEAHFDLIRFPTVGALGGSAGLASTSEQFLLTREAFTDAVHRLSPEGVIAATAWLDFPERNPLRLLATLAEAAETAGLAPSQHLVAVRGWATVTFLLRRTPWTAERAAALRTFCAEHHLDPLLLPGLTTAERERHHVWQNPEFFRLVDRLVAGDRKRIYREHPFAVRPASDDRPYFSQFLRWGNARRLAAVFGSRTVPFFELGSLTVALTFVLLAALAFIGIVLPLLRLGWSPPHRGVFLYFAGLGAGFMAIEIGLMLTAHAWLGSPVPAAVVVLTALLIASGIGSLWSERWPATPHALRLVVALVAGGALAAALLFEALGPGVRAWPVFAQLSILLGLVASLGTAMGLAFPLGLRRTAATAPAHVPWAWAINGCVSVVTPAAAMLLAMTAGFGALFFAAALAYAVAWIGAALPSHGPRSS